MNFIISFGIIYPYRVITWNSLSISLRNDDFTIFIKILHKNYYQFHYITVTSLLLPLEILYQFNNIPSNSLFSSLEIYHQFHGIIWNYLFSSCYHLKSIIYFLKSFGIIYLYRVITWNSLSISLRNGDFTIFIKILHKNYYQFHNITGTSLLLPLVILY